MDATKTSRFVVMVLAALVFFAGLGSARLWDRDEPRNARCAQEMYERGDWVVPTFNGELRTHKPILLYWMQILAYHTVGANEWGARLPSAVCGFVTVLACYGIAMRLVGPIAAIWSAVALSTSIMFVVASRAATPDGPLICCSTLAIYLFIRALFREQQFASEKPASLKTSTLPTLAQWSGVYAVCGLAVLAKGPVGFVLPATVMGIFLVWQTWPATIVDAKRQSANRITAGFSFVCKLAWQGVLTAWGMRPFTAIIAVLLVAGPWYLAVGIATDGQWLREFFWTHNVSRAMNTMEGHSGPPLLFYFVTLCVGSFPWSIWMLPTTIYLYTSWQTRLCLRPAIVLGCAWIGVYVGCFSVAATKLPSYITPCYPAAAMLYGVMLAHWARDGKSLIGWARIGLAISVCVGLGMAIGVGLIRIAGETPLSLLAPAGFMLLIGAAVASRFMATGQPSLALKAYAVGAVGMVVMLAALGPVLVDGARDDLDFVVDAVRFDRSRIGFVGEVEPSWIYYANGRADNLSAIQWQQSVITYLASSPNNRVILTSDQSAALESHIAENNLLADATRPGSLVIERLKTSPRTSSRSAGGSCATDSQQRSLFRNPTY